MAKENIKKFEEMLQSDAELRDKIKASSEAYVHMGKEADERAFFEEVIAPVAEGCGAPFTYDEVVELKSQMGEISEEELESVAGGKWAFCIFLGVSSDVSAEANTNECHACAYVGIGILDFTR
jgi:hypothetical protein